MCAVTGTPFVEGEFFYTLLFDHEGQYERLDLSETAWEERKKDPSASIPFSLWRSAYELRVKPTPEAFPNNDPERMLRHLLASNDIKNLHIIYILGVMLERKKILKPLPSTQPSLLVYEHASTGETFLIEDPHLSLENLLQVQQEVSVLLSNVAVATQQKERGKE
jgi:hypothetical protein